MATCVSCKGTIYTQKPDEGLVFNNKKNENNMHIKLKES